MNWKVNYWTVLFALATIGLLVFSPLFSYESKKSIAGAPSCDTARLDTIGHGEAEARIVSHLAYSDLVSAAFDTLSKMDLEWKLAIELLAPTNIDVVYFHLPRCELNEMLSRIPNGDVYAFPVLEPDPTYPEDSRKKRIGLIFHDKPYRPQDVAQTVANGGGDEYFDFVDPCPNSCPK